MPFGEYPPDDSRASKLLEQTTSLEKKSVEELERLFEERIQRLRATLDQDMSRSADPEEAALLRDNQEILLEKIENSLDPDEFETAQYTDENGQEAFLKDYFASHLDAVDDLEDVLLARTKKIYALPPEPALTSPNTDLFPDRRVPMPEDAEYTPVANEFVRRLEASANQAPTEIAQAFNRLDVLQAREADHLRRLEEYFALPAPEPGARGIYELPTLPTVQTREATVSTLGEIVPPRRGDERASFDEDTVVMPIIQPAQKKGGFWSKIKSRFGL